MSALGEAEPWPPASSGVGPDDFRAAMGQFASGVTVISAVVDGRAHAMTATAFCSVSLEPPLVLVSVGRASRFHPALAAAQGWAVSILAADQQQFAVHFADRRRDLATQFDGISVLRTPEFGAPVLSGAHAWLECRTWDRHQAGDHTLVLGLVGAVGVSPDGRGPLTYHHGRFRPA